jgi:hypothetical protein
MDALEDKELHLFASDLVYSRARLLKVTPQNKMLISEVEQFYVFVAVELELRKLGRTMKLTEGEEAKKVDVMRAADFVRGQIYLEFEPDLNTLMNTLEEYFNLGFFPSKPLNP